MEIHRVDASFAADYAALTYPFYRKALLSISPDEPVAAFGYSALGVPLGLILAWIAKDLRIARILSVFVDKASRNRGIGTTLMESMEAEIAFRGCTELHVQYKAKSPAAPILERLMQKLGWEEPRLYLLTCKVQGEDVHRLMKASWMSGYRLPPEFEIFPWRDATGEDHERAREVVENLRLVDGTTFLERAAFDPMSFDPLNSLGLRHNNRVIGCMLTQHVSPGVMRYDNMFVREEFQRMGRGIVLVAEAIKLQYARDRDLPTVGGLWRSRAVNAPMIRFIRRRLGPYLTSELETKHSVKHLAAQGEPE